MNDYIVSARKYRPSNFKSVVGQKSLTATLKNAIQSGRLAQAYLFCGPRGVGKTSCARIFAKTINCLNRTPEGEACGECESCKAIERGNSFNLVEMDAASNNSVDNIRNLTEEVRIAPQIGKYRVFIIDEVHMLSSSAFNAFLKTLEEPPEYVIFILATTEKHKVIPTILSRCQIYDFKRITTPDIVEHLSEIAEIEGIKAAPEALNVIGRKADGGMRDALSIFDQVAASSMGNITYKSAITNLNVLDYDYYFDLVESFRSGDAGNALLIYNEITDKGFDNLFFINGLASHIRDLMVAADTRTTKLLEVTDDVLPKYTQQAQSLPLNWYYSALKLINDADYSYRTATNKRLLVELLLIRLSQLLTPPSPPFDRVDNEIPLKKTEVKVIPQPSANNPVASKAVEPARVAQEVKATEESVAETKKETTGTEKVPVSDNKSKPRRGKQSLRLTDLEDEVAREIKTDRRQEVSEQQFLDAWESYIKSHDEKSILIDTMKAYKPSQAGKEEFLITVIHPAQRQAIEGNISKIITFIKEKVENDFVALRVNLEEREEVIKPMPSNELFKDIVKNNKSMRGLMELVDPELNA